LASTDSELWQSVCHAPISGRCLPANSLIRQIPAMLGTNPEADQEDRD